MKKLFYVLSLVLSISIVSSQTTVSIVDQKWMTKNLNTRVFKNGDSLLEVKTEKEWKKAIKEKKPAWCYYDNDPTNESKHGLLYNVFAIEDARGLAPEGYRIPSNEDWDKLAENLEGWQKAGTKLKNSTEWDGDNSTGFNGLPSGIRFGDGPNGYGGTFANIGIIGFFWSSRRDAWYLKIKKKSLVKIPSSKGVYMSVRCLAN